MNLLTKILNIIGLIFDWLTNHSRQRRNERYEADKRRNDAVEELRKVNDEMLLRLAEMYRTVNDNNVQILKLQSENAALVKQLELTTQKLELLTKQNKQLIMELQKREMSRKPKGNATNK